MQDRSLAVGTPIGALCRRLEVTPRTLRLYEERGLVVARRSHRGDRVYDPEEVARVSLVVALRQLGYGLSEIGGLIDLASGERDRIVAEKLTALCRRRGRELAYLIEVLEGLRQGQGLTQTLSTFLECTEPVEPSDDALSI